MELLDIVVVQATKLANSGILAVTLSDISEENMKVVEREGFLYCLRKPRSLVEDRSVEEMLASDLYS